MSLPVFATPAGAGAWTLQVVVTPGGSRDVLAGLAEDRLRVRLRAKAVEGAANAALTTFLAAVFGVRPRQVRLVAGERSRKKRIRIETESEPDWSAVAGMGCDENRQQGVVAMDQRDLDLIVTYGEADPELKSLYEEHIAFEKILEKMEGKPFRTPSEETELREIKKKKLAGKTRIETLLLKYRKAEDK